MNYNPLLIKSFIIGNMPFIKELTQGKYGMYLSNHKFSQESGSIEETVSAYTLRVDDPTRRGYLINRPGVLSQTIEFALDESDIKGTTYFSEREWIGLGLLLRAYKEVEGIDLMHLYNCLYSASGDQVTGKVVIGREYTLYGSSQLPVEIIAKYRNTDLEIEIVPSKPVEVITGNLSSGQATNLSNTIAEDTEGGQITPVENNQKKYLSRSDPIHFKVINKENTQVSPGILVDLTIKFVSGEWQPSTLVEGNYPGLRYLSGLKDPFSVGYPLENLPEPLGVGEYSRKLVEFAAGSLITHLSEEKLRTSVERQLTRGGTTFEEKVKKATPGVFNKDGYCDRRIKV